MSSGVAAHDHSDGAGEAVLAAWKLPLIVTAISVSIVTGFYLGGPGLGLAVGGLAAASIVVFASRRPPLDPIIPARASDDRSRLLVVLSEPLEDPRAIEAIAIAAEREEEADPEILVLAPTCHSFLDRWASDIEPGRRRAQRALVLSLASLARAGLDATASLGAEDLVQAVEDQLGGYPATMVIFVSGEQRDAARAAAIAAALRARLRVPFHHLRQSERATLGVAHARA